MKRREDSMPELKDQLVKHIGEAHAMEQSVLRLLDDMIGTTEDPQIREELEHHREETERHAARMEDCLASYGESPSLTKEVGGVLGAVMKSAVDLARGEKAGRNARDGFATEHLEIASYELLERIALKAGDERTAQAARENRADEEAMAQKLASHWDKFAELSLVEEGVSA
jgi:ferritin-like metal-binding protein YciE